LQTEQNAKLFGLFPLKILNGREQTLVNQSSNQAFKTPVEVLQAQK